MKTGGAHSSGIERIPLMPAATRPQVVLAQRPAAKRTSDARSAWFLALLLLDLAVQYNQGLDGAIRNGDMTRPLRTGSGRKSAWRFESGPLRA